MNSALALYIEADRILTGIITDPPRDEAGEITHDSVVSRWYDFTVVWKAFLELAPMIEEQDGSSVRKVVNTGKLFSGSNAGPVMFGGHNSAGYRAFLWRKELVKTYMDVK